MTSSFCERRLSSSVALGASGFARLDDGVSLFFSGLRGKYYDEQCKFGRKL